VPVVVERTALYIPGFSTGCQIEAEAVAAEEEARTKDQFLDKGAQPVGRRV
jgi:hypothetical protein